MATSRAKSLVTAGACLVAVLLALVVYLSRQREANVGNEIRKQTAFVMLELSDEMEAATVAMQEFNSDGGLDLSGLEDPAALQRRIELAAKSQAAAQRVLQFGEALPNRLGELLQRLPAENVDQAKRQLPEKTNWSQGRHIFQTHARAYAAARAHLEFMKKHHGHWRVDAVGMRVNWDSRQLQAEAEKLQERVTAAAAAQGTLATLPATTQRPSGSAQP